MEILKILAVILWLLCGFLAYGMMKGQWRNFNEQYKIAAYNKGDEWYAICAAMMGLLGLFMTFVGSLLNGYWGFCLRMPANLRKIK